MKLTERVLKEKKRNEQEKKDKTQFWQNEEDNMGYMYEDAPRWKPLNEDGGVFANKDDKSINTAPSVFERTTLFRVTNTDSL